MATSITTDLIERVAPMVRGLVASRSRAHLRYADIRLEVIEGKYAAAENGDAKGAGEDATMGFGVRVLAGDAMAAPGYFGRGLGEADIPNLERVLEAGLDAAYRRAMANAEWKRQARGKFGPLGESLADTRLHPIRVCRDTVAAVYEMDPRTMDLAEMTRFTRDISRRVKDSHASLGYNYVSTMTQLARELFASSEGALIDQAFALTQGLCYVVANGVANSQEVYDVLGHQRGWEILLRGVNDPVMSFPPFADFALAIARDAVELSTAPSLPWCRTRSSDIPSSSIAVSRWKPPMRGARGSCAGSTTTRWDGKSPRPSSPPTRIPPCPVTATMLTTTKGLRPGASPISTVACSAAS